MRVTGQLIDAGTGAHVWSERWDRPADDIFAVQTEIAEQVAAALGGDLTMGQVTRAELARAKRLRPNDLAGCSRLASTSTTASRISIPGTGPGSTAFCCRIWKATLETRNAMGFRCLDNLDAILAGRPAPDAVN